MPTTVCNPRFSTYVPDYLYIPHKLHPIIKRLSIDEHTEDHMATALSKVITALAHLHRAGRPYKQRSEAFWPFCAGTWAREEYEEQLAWAVEELGGKRDTEWHDEENWERSGSLMNGYMMEMGIGEGVQVRDEVRAAEDLLDDAIALLREHVDERDAEDLENARDAYRSYAKW